MATIPKMNSARPISNRVDTPRQSVAGVGASAKALANIGGMGAKIGNQLLLERKKAEAENYRHEKSTDKSRTRDRLLTGLKSYMNPDDGVVNVPEENGEFSNYNGMQYAEAVSKFELEYDDRAKEEAPTDLARKMYESTANSTSEKSMVVADSWQHGQMAVRKQTRDFEKAQQVAKDIQSIAVNTDDYNAIDVTERELKSNNEYFQSNARFYYTGQEADIKRKEINNLQAKAGMDTAIDVHKDYPRAMKAIRFSFLDKPEDNYDLISNVTEGEVDFHKIGKEGTTFYSKEGKKLLRVDHENRIEFFVAEKTKIGMEPINVEAIKKKKNVEMPVLEPTEIEKALTVAQKREYILKSLRNAKQVDARKMNEIKDRYSNLVNLGQDPKLRSEQNPEEFRGLVFDLAKDIEKYVKDETTRDKMLINLVNSPRIGEVKDQLKNMSKAEARSIIDNLKPENLLDSDLASVLPLEQDLIDDRLSQPDFVTNIIQPTRTKLDNYYFNNIRPQQEQAPADFAILNDKRSGYLYEKAVSSSSPKDFDDFVDHLQNYQQDLNIPENKKAILPEVLLESYKSQFSNYLDTADSVKASAWLHKHKSQWGEHYPKVMAELAERGLDKNYAYAGILLDGPNPDIYGSARIMENVKESKKVEEHFGSKFPEVVKSVESRVIAESIPFLRALSSQNIFGENVRSETAILEVLKLDVLRQIRQRRYQDITYDVDRAVINPTESGKMVNRALSRLEKNFSIMGEKSKGTEKATGSSFIMPTSEVQKHGITNDDIENIEKDFNNRDYVSKNVDVEKTVLPLLEQRGIKPEVLKKQKGPKAYNDFLEDTYFDPSFMGKQILNYDGKKGRIQSVWETPDGEKIPIIDKKGRILGVDTKDVRNYVEKIKVD